MHGLVLTFVQLSIWLTENAASFFREQDYFLKAKRAYK